MRLSPDALTARVRELLNAYGVPGAAMSIVIDGEPLYQAFVGVISTRDPWPVIDSATFDIGAITKTFTATAVALLVEEGRFDWDTPVIDLMPDFRLSEPSLTPLVTVRDLVGQTVGWGEDNITNYHSHFTRADLVRQLRWLPLRTPFRQELAYQQYGPVVAGTLVERATGKTWEDFVEERICAPLGLKDTVANGSRVRDRSMYCDPHMDLGDGAMSAFTHRDFSGLGPAGSMVSSLRDLEVWLSVFAGNGRTKGVQLLKPETVANMLEPGVPVRRDSLNPLRRNHRFEANVVTYGLGWFGHDFGGRWISEHTGMIEGFQSVGCVVPQDRVAVTILTNQHRSPALAPLRYLLLAHALEVPQQDWDARATAVAMVSAARPARGLNGEPYPWRPLQRALGTSPSWPMDHLEGDFVHEGFGLVQVRVHGTLQINLLGNTCILEHWHHDLFRAVPVDPAIRSIFGQVFLRFDSAHLATPDWLDIPTIGRFKRTYLSSTPDKKLDPFAKGPDGQAVLRS